MDCKNMEDTNKIRETGNEFYRKGLFSEAEKAYSRAIDICSTDARLYQNRAQSRIRLNPPLLKEALIDVRRARDIDSAYFKAWLLEANVLMAIYSQTAPTIDKNSMEGLVDKAQIREQAFVAFNRAVELNEECADLDKLEELLMDEFRSIYKKQTVRRSSEGNILDQFLMATKEFEEITDDSNKGRIIAIKQTSIAALIEITEDECLRNEIDFNQVQFKALSMIGYCSHALGENLIAKSCCFVRYFYFKKMKNSVQFVLNGNFHFNEFIENAKLLTFSNLFTIYFETGETNLARKWLNKAFTFVSDHTSEEYVSLRINQARLLYLSDLEFNQAIQILQNCIGICQQAGLQNLEAEIKLHLVNIYMYIGNYKLCLQLSKELYAVNESLNNRHEMASNLNIQGSVLMKLNQKREAIELFDKSLAIYPIPFNTFKVYDFKGEAYVDTASDFEKEGDTQNCILYLQKAIGYFEKSLSISKTIVIDEWRRVNIELNIHNTLTRFPTFSSEDSLKCERFYEKVLAKALKDTYSDIGKIYFDYSIYLIRIKNIPKAIEMSLLAENEFAKGFKRLKEDEFIISRKDRGDWKFCNKFLQACYFFEDSVAALLTAERGKNRYFEIPSEKVIDFPKQFDMCKALKCAIIIFADLYNTYTLCWLILPNNNGVIKTLWLQQAHGTHREKPNDGSPSPDIPEVPVIVEVTAEKFLSELSKSNFRTFPFNKISLNEHDDILIQNLWEIIEKEIDITTLEKIVFIPDGRYWMAKWSKLLTRNELSLMSRCTISICPSLTTLHENMKGDAVVHDDSNSFVKRAFIIADTRGDLPFAMEEANLLEQFITKQNNWSVKTFLQESAVRDEIVKALNEFQFDILHIAAHANLNPDPFQVLLGSIFLATTSTGEFDELTYKEISRFDLSRVQLAFLNCCETGSGTVHSEGLVGLARAFFIAGVKQVVVYSGPVPDTESTLRLVNVFYEEYFKCWRAEMALAVAQRDALERGVAEDLWASYYVMSRI